MKRLLARIGITYFSVLAVAFYLPEKATVILLSAASLGSFALFLIRRARRTVWLPAVALTIAIACLVNLGFTYLRVIPVQEHFAGSGRRIEATLVDEPYTSYSKYYYRLRIDRIDGEETDEKLLLKTASDIGMEPYDTVAFTADIYRTENSYYLSKGYYLTVDTYDVDFAFGEPQRHPLYYYAIQLRQSLRDALEEYLPDDVSALCKAVLVGDKYALDADTKADFRYAGASYFVVVSGMHFSLICLLFFRLLRRLRVNRYLAAILTLLLILVYMAVTGFQPSVVRSGVMMIVLILSRLIRRMNDSHNSLGLAGIVCSFVFSPYGVGDIGLILSFSATFAVISWSGPIYRKICIKKPNNLFKRIVNYVLTLLSTSLAANILVFPISVFVFRGFSMVTILSSVLLYLPISAVLILSLVIFLLFYLGPLRYLSLLLSWPLFAVGKYVLFTVNGIASWPFSYININDTLFYIWVGITVVLGVLAALCRHRFRMIPYAVMISAIILLTGTAIITAIDLNTFALTVYNCGEGLTVGYQDGGTLSILAFNADSKNSIRLLEDFSHRFGEAQLAVCSQKSDYNRYSRLSDKEFAISHYLLYDSSTYHIGDSELIAYNAAQRYILSDHATLTVHGSGGRLMSRLEVDGLSIIVIPKNYPVKAIPDDFRTADIIVMAGYQQGYESLSCGTLIVSNTAENAAAVAEAMAGRYQMIEYTYSGDVTIPTR